MMVIVLMESFISNFGTIDTTTHNILMKESRRKSAVLPHKAFSGQKRQSGNQYILDKCILIWDDPHTSIHWVWRYETGPVRKTFSKPSPQWKGYGSTLSRWPSGPGGRTCRSHELLIVDNDSQNGAPTTTDTHPERPGWPQHMRKRLKVVEWIFQ